jgi:hypothetical protein
LEDILVQSTVPAKELRKYRRTSIVKLNGVTEHATADESVNHPKMLLVDDNAINLKVISMRSNSSASQNTATPAPRFKKVAQDYSHELEQ